MSRSQIDRWVGRLLGSLTWITATLAIFIIGFLAWQAWPALLEVGPGRLFTDSRWLPKDDLAPQYRITALLIGSFLVAAGSMLWAAPVGILTSLYATFYAPRWLAALLNRLIEVLAGVPSVVFGFWGLTAVVPLISAWKPFGLSLLAGAVVLGLMILPTIVLATRSAFQSVSPTQILAARAVGLTQWGIIRAVVIPVSTRGIIAGCVLAVTRAIGETMAVLMVCGNVVQVPQSIFDPVRTITSNIALEMGDALDLHQSVLFATGLILLMVVSAMVLLFQWRFRETKLTQEAPDA